MGADGEGFIAAAVRALRHPVRALAALGCAFAVVGGFADGFGIAGALLGALIGTIGGEALGRSRLRTPVVGLAVAGGWLSTRAIAAACVGGALVPWLLGPVGALRIASIVGFGGGLLFLVGGLRVLAVRHTAALYVELGVMIAGIAAIVAGHRDGAIARPLWLSDASWRWGIDPSVPLVVLGVSLALACAAYALLETRNRLPRAAWLLLPLIVAWSAWIAARVADAPPTLPPIVTASQQLPGGGGGGAEPTDGDGGGGGPDGDRPEGGGGTGGEPDTDLDTDAAPAGGTSLDPTKDPVESKGNPAVAVVILDDDYSPPSGYYYLRQEAQSDYNGHRLIPADRPDVDRDVPERFPTRTEPVPAPRSVLPRTRVHARVALLAEHPTPFSLDTPVAIAPLANPAPNRFLRAYAIDVVAPTWEIADLVGRTAGDPAWSPGVWAMYTAGPPDPRYAQLANRLVATLPPHLAADPAARALVIKQHLDANMKYTRRSRHAHAPDPVADFLFGDMKGYCVHSASAAVYLWRSVGLPARVGTGYAVDEADRRGSGLIVRAGDAHAWPELYLDGLGWVVLDVNPAVDLDPPSPPLDDDLAKLLADMARQTPEQRAAHDWTPWWALAKRAAAITATLTALLTLTTLYAAKTWRRWRPAVASAADLPRVGYRAALDRLTEAGFVREEGESREAFARRVGDRAPAFGAITDLHLAGRLGNGAPDRPEFQASVWRRVLGELRTEMPRVAPWWRRWLGLFDPTSVLRAR